MRSGSEDDSAGHGSELESTSDDFFTDRDEDDLQLSDVSSPEEVDILNPELLELFGEKVAEIQDSETGKLLIEESETSTPPGEDENKDEIPEEPEKKDSELHTKRLMSIDRIIQVDTAEVMAMNPVLPDATLDAAVDDIITRIRTRASVEERTRRHSRDKYDFAAFNWKPNPDFFRFGEQSVAAASSDVNGQVFTFTPAIVPITSTSKRRPAVKSVKAKNINKLKFPHMSK